MDSSGNFPSRDDRVVFGSGEKSRRKSAEKKKTTPYSRNKNKKKRRKPNSQRVSLMAGSILVLILLLIVAGCVHKNGTEIFVGKTSVGILKGRDVTAEDLKKTITAQLEKELGSKVQINEDLKANALHISKARKNEVCTVDYLVPKIRKAITYKVEAGVIHVEGARAAVLANTKEAEGVIAAVKSEYVPEGADMEVSFVEKVEIVNEFVDSKEIITKEAALEKLQNSTETQKTYTVKSNDALFKIAKSADMTVEKLLEINSGMDLQKSLRVGQVINILAQKPYVSVKTVETVVMTAVEPKTFEYKNDNTKNKGYQKVVQQGRAGQKESTMQIIRINGFVEDEKEISKKVTVEPVPEIIVQGTK